MESFIGDIFDLRDKIGEHLTKHIKELNKSFTLKEVAKLHQVTIGSISNINSGSYSRISFVSILEIASSLDFEYNFSITNKNNVNKITYSINLKKRRVL